MDEKTFLDDSLPGPGPKPRRASLFGTLTARIRMSLVLLLAVVSAVCTLTLGKPFPVLNLPRGGHGPYQNVSVAAKNKTSGINKPGQPLRFNKDGTFQIAVFSDLHFGENAWDTWGPQQDINSQKVMRTVLDADNQDFVVLNGDLITGENAYKFNASDYVAKIVAPLLERDLTWASTYGNHDSSFNLSREVTLQHERQYPNARSTQMVSGRLAGVSNYYLPVYASDGSMTPKLLLWFFDSRGGFYYQERNASGSLVGQPDWVDKSVVDWFQQTNSKLVSQYGGAIPSLAFVHIPTNASQALQTGPKVDPNKQPGINDDYILAGQAQGWCPNGDNDCQYGGQDTPFMQAITSTPGLMAVFSGHDHGDTWCYKWKGLIPGMTVAGNGVNLCFNQHSGYGGYGNWIRGAREVLVTEQMLKSNAVDTWIRLEDGSKVGAVSLNSTYGKDIYPATPDRMTHCPTCNYSVITNMPGT